MKSVQAGIIGEMAAFAPASHFGGFRAMYFSDDALETLKRGHSEVAGKCQQLVQSYLMRDYRNAQAREFAIHGFSRRLKILVRAIDNVFEILPPELVEPPPDDKIFDAMINIQAFVFNAFGCIDNLAWIWMKETELPITDNWSVGLFGEKTKKVREHLSNEFKDYLTGLDKWFDNLKNFRDALAHRIPLYIPPYTIPKDKEAVHNQLVVSKRDALKRRDREEYQRLETEGTALAVFVPQMTHSIDENVNFIEFHPQLLTDFKTIEVLAQQMFQELDRVNQAVRN